MASIGHQLQHAVEVLSNPAIRSHGAMILHLIEMCGGCGLRFETDAAIRAGNAVLDELRMSAAAGERRE